MILAFSANTRISLLGCGKKFEEGVDLCEEAAVES